MSIQNHILMQDLIKSHLKYDTAKETWIYDLLKYIKEHIEEIGNQIIGTITNYENKFFFTVSRVIHQLLFLPSEELYHLYQKLFSELSKINSNRQITERSAQKKVREFIRNLSEVLCVASLSEGDIDAIYTSNYFKDSNETSSLRINFETLDIKDVYQRYQILENRISHEKRIGRNRYSDPHEFCFICETEGEFMYVAILV